MFGLLPLLYGVWDNRHEFLAYLTQKKFSRSLLIFSESFGYIPDDKEKNMGNAVSEFTILQYYWISLALQVHCFHILFIQQLRQILSSLSCTRLH